LLVFGRSRVKRVGINGTLTVSRRLSFVQGLIGAALIAATLGFCQYHVGSAIVGVTRRVPNYTRDSCTPPRLRPNIGVRYLSRFAKRIADTLSKAAPRQESCISIAPLGDGARIPASVIPPGFGWAMAERSASDAAYETGPAIATIIQFRLGRRVSV